MITTKTTKEIQLHDFIFFDIFDTLITRPFLNPKDLFSYIEYSYKAPGFYKARIRAELSARNGNEEVTIHDIYNHIPCCYKNLMCIEENLELALCYRIEENYSLYQYALSLDKKIFFLSDMYLTSNTICDLLNKNGYKCSKENLFLSSEYKKTKHSGALFDIAIKKLNIKDTSKVIMIGDNQNSDYKIPQQKKIHALLFTRKYQALEKSNFLKFLYNNPLPPPHQNSLSPIIKFILNQHKITENYWQEIGFTLAGPLVYSYLKFILDKIDQIATHNEKDIELLFIGRDGYLLNKCLPLINNKIAHQYIFAPRELSLAATLDGINQNINQENIFRSNLLLYRYQQYLRTKINPKNKIFIVDTRTENFSAQNLIQKALNKCIVGFYWEITSQIKSLRNNMAHIEFKDCHNQIKAWRLFEYLVTSPEAPIKSIDSQLNPIYQDAPEEFTRKRVFSHIESGCIQFIKQFTQQFGNQHFPPIYYADIAYYINAFLDHPNKEDIIQFQTSTIATDINHSNYLPFLSSTLSFNNFKRDLKALSQCYWHTIPQQILLHITHPLKLSKRGQTIQLSLFPKFKNNVFEFSIFIKPLRFSVTIGNHINSI